MVRLSDVKRLATSQTAKVAVASALLLLAIFRIVFFDSLERRTDKTFFLILGAALLILVLPWDRLTSFKAAGVEFTLDRPEVAAAIRSLDLDRLQDEQLKGELSKLTTEITEAAGGRALWIDDKPHEVVALRRLLRALDVETVIARSTREADEILASDNDFDLIVSDVQRRDEGDQQTFEWFRRDPAAIESDSSSKIVAKAGWTFIKLHEGVNYVVRIRTEAGRDPVIASLPVLFYAAYDWSRLARFTAVALATSPDTEISNSPLTFVPKAIRMLAGARSSPIVVGKKKKPT
jgi:CheY-like chemotaxis protein